MRAEVNNCVKQNFYSFNSLSHRKLYNVNQGKCLFEMLWVILKLVGYNKLSHQVNNLSTSLLSPVVCRGVDCAWYVHIPQCYS